MIDWEKVVENLRDQSGHHLQQSVEYSKNPDFRDLVREHRHCANMSVLLSAAIRAGIIAAEPVTRRATPSEIDGMKQTLVDRIRAEVDRDVNEPLDRLLEEAADEIERLQEKAWKYDELCK